MPWGGPPCPHREAAWEWVQRRWALLHPGYRLVTGTCEGEWSTSVALNDAIRKAEGTVILTAADAALDPQIVTAAVDAAADGWVLPASTLIRPNRKTTAGVLGLPPDWPMDGVGGEQQRSRKGWGPIVAPVELLREVPYDERFTKWGAEDEAFCLAATSLVGNPMRLPGSVVLLWHPRHRRHDPVHYEANLRLLARYQTASTPTEVRMLMNEQRRVDQCGFTTPGGPCPLAPRHQGPHRSPWIPLDVKEDAAVGR